MNTTTKKGLIQSIKAGLIHSFRLNGITFNVIPSNLFYMIEKINDANLASLEIID